MSRSGDNERWNVTISLSREMLKKAKALAARRKTSLSGLVAEQIESLVGEEEAYERARREALAMLEKGFRMGGRITAKREELRER